MKLWFGRTIDADDSPIGNFEHAYEMKDGKKVYVTEILANNISFLDAKGSGTSGNNSFYGMPEPPMEQEAVQPERVETVSATKDPFEAFGDSIEISDNDLPF